MKQMNIDVLTLFPEMFSGVFSSSILKRAEEKELVQYRVTNFRQFAEDKHHRVDDYPYGGGHGMVLKPEPIFQAVEKIAPSVGEPEHEITGNHRPRVILMCPQGEPYTQTKAEQLATEDHLVLICGHYEGYDERIRQHLVTDEISIGDYVLTGGELPAMVVIDSVVRLREGVLGNQQSSEADSFSTGLLEYPQYTRPAQFRDLKVPDVLLSGHHDRIAEWRKQQSLYRTWKRRPELIENMSLSAKEKEWLEKWKSKES